jgi:prepilin-type N-terminal cleavage/methylation domain-containing protein
MGHEMYLMLSEDKKGFTLVEVLVVAFILAIIVLAFSKVLNVGNLANPISSTKLLVQQEVRNVLDWIVKDVRQTSSYQINNNNPSVNHIKFKTCVGHDGTNLLWSNDFIEYTYDVSSETLTRLDYSSGNTWQFYDIVASPFDTSELVDNVLSVTVAVEKTARGLIKPSASLTMEVKLRNG